MPYNGIDNTVNFVAAASQSSMANTFRPVLRKLINNQVKHVHLMTTEGNIRQIAPKAGAIAIIRQNVVSNGFSGLYGGITAGLQRQVAFCAVRIGCYDSIKNFYQDILPGDYL